MLSHIQLLKCLSVVVMYLHTSAGTATKFLIRNVFKLKVARPFVGEPNIPRKSIFSGRVKTILCSLPIHLLKYSRFFSDEPYWKNLSAHLKNIFTLFKTNRSKQFQTIYLSCGQFCAATLLWVTVPQIKRKMFCGVELSNNLLADNSLARPQELLVLSYMLYSHRLE